MCFGCCISTEAQRQEWERQRQAAHLRWLAEERKRELEELRVEIERHRRFLAYAERTLT